MKHNKLEFIDEIMADRQQQQQYRLLRSIVPISTVDIKLDDLPMVNFSSNDYLGLAKNEALKNNSKRWINQYGNGATASRLISGSFDCINKLEAKLARFKCTERALILNTGFQANISIIPALADKKSLILSDQLNHNSIIQGCILARCKKIVFRHNDTEHLEQLLIQNQQKGFSRIFIISETVFSMDGDCCNLDRLHQLAEQFNAILMVDEAHATGVLGERGMGLASEGRADIIVGTFGKACGAFGAYVACSEKVRDYLINYCSGFIFSTALPPSVLGAIDAALDLIPEMEAERLLIQQKAEYIRRALLKLKLSTANSSTQIVPIIIGDEINTIKIARWLESRGILATAIRPPTVPVGQSRIRIAVSSSHSWQQIKTLISLFEEYYETATA